MPVQTGQKAQYSDAQSMSILKQTENGGMDASLMARMKELDEENKRQKSWRDQKRPQWGVFPEQRMPRRACKTIC